MEAAIYVLVFFSGVVAGTHLSFWASKRAKQEEEKQRQRKREIEKLIRRRALVKKYLERKASRNQRKGHALSNTDDRQS